MAFAVYHGTSIVIRKLGIFLIILLGLLVFILSPAGLHAVVRVASWFLPGQLTYQSLHGELGKVIDVKNVTYRSETIDLKISSLHFTWHPWSLFHKEIQVKDLQIKGIQLKINKTEKIKKEKQAVPQTSNTTPIFTPLILPMSLRIDHLEINHFQFEDYVLRKAIQIGQLNLQGLLNTNNSNLQLKIHFRKSDLTAYFNGPLSGYRLQMHYRSPNYVWQLNGQGDQSKMSLSVNGIENAKKIFSGSVTFAWSPILEWTGQLWTNNVSLIWFSSLPLANVSFNLETNGEYDGIHLTQVSNLSNLSLAFLNDEFIRGSIYLQQKYHQTIFRTHLKDAEKDYLTIEALIDDVLSIQWGMRIGDLSDFWMPVGGSMSSQGYVRGNINNPVIKGSFNCNTINFGDFILDQLHIHVNGTLPQHTIRINGSLNNTKFSSLINGQMQTNHDNLNWSGSMTQLNILSQSLKTWQLAQPAYFYVSPDQIEIHHGVLRSPDGELNTDISYIVNQQLLQGHFNFSLLKLPLSTLDVTLSQVNVNLNAKDHAAKIEAGFISGKSPLTLTGKADWENYLKLSAALKGNDVEMMNTPQYQISLSPDLKLTIDHYRIDLAGKIIVPQMKIAPQDLTSVVLMPNDASFVGEPPKHPSLWKFYMKIYLALGDKVFLDAYGLKGKLNGSLYILKEPDQVITGSGKLYLTQGTYNLLQQLLTVTKGNLNFINSPITNPNLEVQAVRQFTSTLTSTGFGLERFQAGAEITGTLQQPKITLFSQPITLSQTDILSYLLFGHSAGQGSTSATTMLLLQAVNNLKLGQANSPNFIQKLQSDFGFTELGVETQTDVDAIGNTLSQQNAFVVGRYLTPEIYLRYSRDLIDQINVLEVRYLLSQHWMVQSTASTQGTGADVLYTIEGGKASQ